MGRLADEVSVNSRRRRGHAVDPDHEPAFAIELAVDLSGISQNSGVVHARQARFEHEPLCQEQVPLDIVAGRGGNRSFHQAHRPIDENAGRHPIGVANNLAALGGLGISRNLGPAHRFGIRPTRVAVDPLEPDGAIRGHGIERSSGGKLAPRPEALVPVPAGDPRVARRGLDPLLDPPRDFG